MKRPDDPVSIGRRATALIRQLSAVAGDPDAVNAVLLRWLDQEDVRGLSLVSMAALRDVFTDCLRPVPLGSLREGDLTLIPPPRKGPR